jgi:hypothetical protein
MTSTATTAKAMNLIAQKSESSFSCQEVGCRSVSTSLPGFKIHSASLNLVARLFHAPDPVDEAQVLGARRRE